MQFRVHGVHFYRMGESASGVTTDSGTKALGRPQGLALAPQQWMNTASKQRCARTAYAAMKLQHDADPVAVF